MIRLTTNQFGTAYRLRQSESGAGGSDGADQIRILHTTRYDHRHNLLYRKIMLLKYVFYRKIPKTYAFILAQEYLWLSRDM